MIRKEAKKFAILIKGLIEASLIIKKTLRLMPKFGLVGFLANDDR